jgi:hypothetical protein
MLLVDRQIVTDLKVGAAFPTDHELHAGSPGVYPMPAASRAIAQADVILSLDWVDLGGTLQTACNGAPGGRVIQVSLGYGWSMDHQALPPVDLFLAANPDQVAIAMLNLLKPNGAATFVPTALKLPDAPTSGPDGHETAASDVSFDLGIRGKTAGTDARSASGCHFCRQGSRGRVPVSQRHGTGRLAQVSRKCHTAATIDRWPDFLDSHRPQFPIQAMCDPATRPQ